MKYLDTTDYNPFGVYQLTPIVLAVCEKKHSEKADRSQQRHGDLGGNSQVHLKNAAARNHQPHGDERFDGHCQANYDAAPFPAISTRQTASNTRKLCFDGRPAPVASPSSRGRRGVRVMHQFGVRRGRDISAVSTFSGAGRGKTAHRIISYTARCCLRTTRPCLKDSRNSSKDIPLI